MDDLISKVLEDSGFRCGEFSLNHAGRARFSDSNAILDRRLEFGAGFGRS